MSDGATRRQFDFAQRELKRPVPLTLAIAAIIGWLAAIGLGWSLVTERS